MRRADIYDPIGDRWKSIDTRVGRRFPTALLLPDGTVLVVNGLPVRGSVGDPRTPQIIDPTTMHVTSGRPWPDEKSRGYHNVALLLPDGRVLTGGGMRTDIRYYSPPYLSNPMLRPLIRSAAHTMTYGDPYAITYENGPVHRVTMLALGTVTHSFDQNARFLEVFSGES
jgi:galactose oxidase